MFSESVDWDSPENVKVLNEAIFHINVIGKKTQVQAAKGEDTTAGEIQNRNNRKLGNKSTSCSSNRKLVNDRSNDKRKGKARLIVDEVSRNCSIGEQRTLPVVKQKDLKRKFARRRMEHSDEVDLVLCKSEDKTLTESNVNVDLTDGCALSAEALKVAKKSRGKLNINGDQSAVIMSSNRKRRLAVPTNDPFCKKTKRDSALNATNNMNLTDRRHIDVGRLKNFFKNSRTVDSPSSNDVDESERPIINKQVTATTLSDRMLIRLTEARFRYINEQMYNCTGSEAAEIFKQDKEAFLLYHSGFQSQVEKWPVNPVDKIIEFISNCGKSVVVADFGCGDAKIARSVPNVVHSFDLVALNSHVIPCDMTHVPLPSSSVDIAVFCLSLMGTNLVQYLCEANRVLKPGATLLIAEVKSRFVKLGLFVKRLKKIGYSLVKKDVDNKIFVWFEFKKTGSPPTADLLPTIELLPCVYKKR